MATTRSLVDNLAEDIASDKPAVKVSIVMDVAAKANVQPLHLLQGTANWLYYTDPELAGDLYSVLEKHGHVKDGKFVR